MTKEDKELLLKDLCARLPYKPKCLILRGQFDPDEAIVKGYDGRVSVFLKGDFDEIELEKIRLYLRPMSSMTEEEWKEYNQTIGKSFSFTDEVDWLNAHHFDYRGLIEKGLALEAPKGMYETE